MSKTIQEHGIEVLEGANACTEHHSGLEAEDIAEWVLAFNGCSCEWNGGKACGTWCDENGSAIAKLKDGRFAKIEHWGDTTGHGCQCSGDVAFFDTMEHALVLGLTEDEAVFLGCKEKREEAKA